ncbi:unnamed protein product [Paramecium primaurelia]|uniref:Uncharacterized protein n=1 Tax=Paramecium primaurelia TaxID=5886 RepID=A0A8S1KQK6_PARPR|nr:unnamed protein product [Paramecium primaurelia]
MKSVSWILKIFIYRTCAERVLLTKIQICLHQKRVFIRSYFNDSEKQIYITIAYLIKKATKIDIYRDINWLVKKQTQVLHRKSYQERMVDQCALFCFPQSFVFQITHHKSVKRTNLIRYYSISQRVKYINIQIKKISYFKTTFEQRIEKKIKQNKRSNSENIYIIHKKKQSMQINY